MNPLYRQQAEEMAFGEIGREILELSRTELYLNLRFLDVALSGLTFVPDAKIQGAGTDGSCYFYKPDWVAWMFGRGSQKVNRSYLHTVFHCLFGHIWNGGGRDREYWDLACDIAAEHLIDGLYLKAVQAPKSMFRRQAFRRLLTEGRVPTAEQIYRNLCRLHPSARELEELKAEFVSDDHRYWEEEESPGQPDLSRRKWEEARERMQTEMELFSKEASQEFRDLEEQVRAENQKKYDYREFLRKFSVLKEEMQVDPDAFDYIFYNYGMELYGNMPLIEPLETKEVQKVEDFVIVIDTSMSCKGELIHRFLQETAGILMESESFSRKINLRILQCDDRVQEDVRITSQEELAAYLENMTVRGFGGTDFRPAFAWVEELLRKKSFTKLRGLIYFTDGYGIFPVKKPPYDTAFVFMKEDYRDADVPPWAIRLVIGEEDLCQRTAEGSFQIRSDKTTDMKEIRP